MKSEAELRFIELLRKPTKSKEEIEEKERVRTLFARELKEEIKDLSEELRAVGSKYIDPWDMVNTKERYPEAIDILIRHIHNDYHDKNKEGIFRALTVREAIGKANKELFKEYNKIPKEKDDLRWVIANTFYTIITDEDVDTVIEIIEDKTNGKSRHRFAADLGAIKLQKAEDFLIHILDDNEMCLYALEALGRMKSQKAFDKVHLLANNPNKLISEAAQKALKHIKL